MKGFTKDGKFRPTGRTKSALKKSDIRKSTRKEVKEGGKTFVKYNYFGKHSAKYEKRTKQSFDKMKWNLVFEDGSDWGFQTNNKKEAERAMSTWNENNGSGTGRMIKIQEQEVVTRDKQSMDEDIVEAKVEDIFDEVASAETGHVHHEKLNKSIHDNIEYILERDHLLKDGDSIFQNVTDLQEETTRKEFEKTGHGESGYYLSQFTVRRNNETIYKGIVEGDITMGALMNMELQMRKV